MKTRVGEPHNDEVLVRRAQEDPAAFGDLYERYVDRIYSYAYHRSQTREDAEDVTAQTFEKALAALPRYEWRGAPFAAWLYRIAGNIIAEKYRSRRETLALDDAIELPTADEGPEDASLSREEIMALRQAIRALPPDQQSAIVLKYSQQMRNKQIGDIMERSEGAVKALLHRATVALRETLTEA